MPGTPPYTVVATAPPVVALQIEDSGTGLVAGTTKNYAEPPDPNYPVVRRVRLLRQRDGVVIRVVWSNAAGEYRFEHVLEGQLYDVVSHDHTGAFNAVIAASILAEPMP